MKAQSRRRESGQVVVIMALAFVGLLGFTALALDGGMVYSDRRTAQNAADAASIAGAGHASQVIKSVSSANWDCTKFASGSAEWTNTTNAAISNANKNDFTIDADASDHNGVELICSQSEKYLDVRVAITRQTSTSLVHFVYNGPLINEVEAVVRIRPMTDFGGGNAIVALKDTCTDLGGGNYDGGVTFSGNSTVTVKGGGVYSNACIVTNGSPGAVLAPGGEIRYNTNYIDNGHKTVDPAPTQTTKKISIDDAGLADQLKADCASLPDHGSKVISGSGSSVTLTQGRYSLIHIKSPHPHVTFEKGLYCVDGHFIVEGGTVDGDGITIFMPETAGAFYTAGGSSIITLSAPPVGCEVSTPGDNCPPAVGGLLLYYLPSFSDATNPDTQIYLAGGSGSNYVGTILAPNNRIDIAGSAWENSPFGAQLIAETVHIRGSSKVLIEYDASKSQQIPAKLQMEK